MILELEKLYTSFNVDKLNKRLFFDVRWSKYILYGTPYANPNNPMPDFSPQKALTLLNEAGWLEKMGSNG